MTSTNTQITGIQGTLSSQSIIPSAQSDASTPSCTEGGQVAPSCGLKDLIGLASLAMFSHSSDAARCESSKAFCASITQERINNKIAFAKLLSSPLTLTDNLAQVRLLRTSYLDASQTTALSEPVAVAGLGNAPANVPDFTWTPAWFSNTTPSQAILKIKFAYEQ